MGIEVALALSEKEKRDSFWVRHEVFAKEGGWIPTNNEEQEYDKYDFSSRAYHLVAYDEGKPVGTVRVLMHDPEIAKEDETRGGLHIEKSFRIDYSGPIDKVIDLSRSSVLRSHRSKNVLASLYAKAVRLVGDFGVEQILGGANPSTNSVEEANLMLSFAKMGCYYSDKISLHPLCTDQTKEPHLYYDLDTSEKLKRIVKENDLYEFFEKYFPPVIRIVTQKFGFTFCGNPSYDSSVNMCSMPMNLTVERAKQNAFLRSVEQSLPPLRNYE